MIGCSPNSCRWNKTAVLPGLDKFDFAEQERLGCHMRPAQEPGIAVAEGVPKHFVMVELLPKDPESEGSEQQNTVAAAVVVVPEQGKELVEQGPVGRQRKDQRRLPMQLESLSAEEQQNWSSEQLEEPAHKLGIAGAAGEPQCRHRGSRVVSPLPIAVAEQAAHTAGAASTETAVLDYQ